MSYKIKLCGLHWGLLVVTITAALLQFVRIVVHLHCFHLVWLFVLQMVTLLRIQYCVYVFWQWTMRYEGGAAKSLARPGRKQATATKLGISSTYSPRSSIHFLARCSNFCKALKFRRLSVQPGLRGSNDLRVGRKMANFQLFFFSVQGTGGSPSGSDPDNRVGNQDTGSQGRPVFLGCKCPVSRGIVVQEQDPLGGLRAARRFSFKMSFNCTIGK